MSPNLKSILGENKEKEHESTKVSVAIAYLTILVGRLRDKEQKYKLLLCIQDPEVLNEGSKQDELNELFAIANLQQDQIKEIMNGLRVPGAQADILNYLTKTSSLKGLVAMIEYEEKPLEITGEAALKMKILQKVPLIFPSVTELKAAFMYLEGEEIGFLNDEQRELQGSKS